MPTWDLFRIAPFLTPGENSAQQYNIFQNLSRKIENHQGTQVLPIFLAYEGLGLIHPKVCYFPKDASNCLIKVTTPSLFNVFMLVV